MTKTLSIAEAKRKFNFIVDKAKNGVEKYTITLKDSPAAILISYDEYKSIKKIKGKM